MQIPQKTKEFLCYKFNAQEHNSLVVYFMLCPMCIIGDMTKLEIFGFGEFK